jgi:hypothetical protein
MVLNLDVVAHASNPSTSEVEAGGFLVPVSLGYTVRLKKPKPNRNKTEGIMVFPPLLKNYCCTGGTL